MKVISESFVCLKNVKEIFLGGENEIRDDGCRAIFENAKYLSNLEVLSIWGNKVYKNDNRYWNDIGIKRSDE